MQKSDRETINYLEMFGPFEAQKSRERNKTDRQTNKKTYKQNDRNTKVTTDRIINITTNIEAETKGRERAIYRCTLTDKKENRRMNKQTLKK